jgi:plastocyanin
MKRALAIFLLVASLVAIAHAADVHVQVGGNFGENEFIPRSILAAPGDNVRFLFFIMYINYIVIVFIK